MTLDEHANASGLLRLPGETDAELAARCARLGHPFDPLGRCPACALARRHAAVYVEAFAHGYALACHEEIDSHNAPWLDAHELCESHRELADERQGEMRNA